MTNGVWQKDANILPDIYNLLHFYIIAKTRWVISLPVSTSIIKLFMA